MNEISLDEEVRKELKNRLKIDKKDIDFILKLYNSSILPEIGANYLSHLKTALEDLINEFLQKAILDQLSSDGKTTKVEYSGMKKLLSGKTFRPFSILLRPIGNSRKKSTVQFFGLGAAIFFYDKLEPKQIRYLIAHELGHIFFKFFGQDNGKNSERIENVSNLFAYIALVDKNDFYSSAKSNFTAPNRLALLSEFLHICSV